MRANHTRHNLRFVTLCVVGSLTVVTLSGWRTPTYSTLNFMTTTDMLIEPQSRIFETTAPPMNVAIALSNWTRELGERQLENRDYTKCIRIAPENTQNFRETRKTYGVEVSGNVAADCGNSIGHNWWSEVQDDREVSLVRQAFAYLTDLQHRQRLQAYDKRVGRPAVFQTAERFREAERPSGERVIGTDEDDSNRSKALSTAPSPGQIRSVQTQLGESSEALAQRLKVPCSQECQPYTQEAQGGSMRVTYEAAACICSCFYQGVPANYAQRGEMKQCAIDYSRKAREFGSTVPVFREE